MVEQNRHIQVGGSSPSCYPLGTKRGKMQRKAIFLGGHYSGKRENLFPEIQVERDGDTYTLVSNCTRHSTVVYVLSGAITRVQELLVTEIDRLDGENEALSKDNAGDKAYIRRLLSETEQFKAVG